MSLRYTQLSIFDPHPCLEDLPLFEKLGLAAFFVPTNYEHFVGSVEFENEAVVEICVAAGFALCWEITIFTKYSHQPLHLEWRGSLAANWPMVETLARGTGTSAARLQAAVPAVRSLNSVHPD